MIRLRRDSTAPRRPGKGRGEPRRSDEALVEQADLVRPGWKLSSRGPF
jgi:hypothetical protein